MSKTNDCFAVTHKVTIQCKVHEALRHCRVIIPDPEMEMEVFVHKHLGLLDKEKATEIRETRY